MALPSPQTGFTIKGVPVVLIEDYVTGKLIARIEKATRASLSIEAPSNSIYGGNSLYPFDYVDGDRSGTLEIETARYQYGLTEAALGAEVTTGTTVIMLATNEKHTIPSESAHTVTLKNGTSLVADSLKVYYTDDGEELTKVETAPDKGEYTISGGVLTFSVDDKGKEIVVDYRYQATSGDLVEVFSYGQKPVVKVTLANEFQNHDGVMMREAITIFKARSSGSYQHQEQRGEGASHTLTFDVMDPERPDGLLFTKGYISVA